MLKQFLRKLVINKTKQNKTKQNKNTSVGRRSNAISIYTMQKFRTIVEEVDPV
jgi:hypothetical protein